MIMTILLMLIGRYEDNIDNVKKIHIDWEHSDQTVNLYEP